MIIKIKPNQSIKINDKSYTVSDVSLLNVNRDGVSSNAVITLEDSDFEEVIIEFGTWSTAMDEKSLDGLLTMLSRG